MSGIQFLLSIDSKIIKYGLDRTIQLLKILGNSHLSVRSIQVVGTNGKGSTSAMMAHTLINNGYNVGLYTSPHLVIINERIRINNRTISNQFIDSFIQKYKKNLLEIEPSFFEIMTVMALSYFVKNKVDFAILETGLGGRLDSVTAALSDTIVFTPIDLDHLSILGKTLSSIATEKSGAISENNSFIFSSIQQPIVKKILNNTAKKYHKKIVYNKYQLEILNLQGAHQIQNANLAKFVLDNLAIPYQLEISDIIQNLQTVSWPGRIQFLQNQPDIIFDVAHNNHSIKAFIQYFYTIQNQYQSKYLIIGFEFGKQIESNLKILYKLFDSIIITETKIRHSMQADYILKLHKPDYKSSIRIELNPINAIKKTIHKMDKTDIAVILGSHYFGPYIDQIFKNSFDIQ